MPSFPVILLPLVALVLYEVQMRNRKPLALSITPYRLPDISHFWLGPTIALPHVPFASFGHHVFGHLIAGLDIQSSTHHPLPRRHFVQHSGQKQYPQVCHDPLSLLKRWNTSTLAATRSPHIYKPFFEPLFAASKRLTRDTLTYFSEPPQEILPASALFEFVSTSDIVKYHCVR